MGPEGDERPRPPSEGSVSTSVQHSPSSATSTSRLLSRSHSSSSGLYRHRSASNSRGYPYGGERRIFIRRMPSPAIGKTTSTSERRNSHSSDNGCHGCHGNRVDQYHSSDVFLPPDVAHVNGIRRQSSYHVRDATSSSVPLRHTRTSSLGAMSFISRTSSAGDCTASLPHQQSVLAEEALHAPRIMSRTSTRRSIGQEWTRYHWHKIKDLEQKAERFRRCSKLSSGFAPLMVFGGLVFVCIGISASTNTGKDSERLKQLSAAPLAMGIFMLILGTFLIITWFGCRSHARKLDHKVLHGSRRNSTASQDNLVQAVVAKLYSQIERTGIPSRESPQTPTMPGVTADGGVVVHKTTNISVSNARNERCNQCGSDVSLMQETSV